MKCPNGGRCWTIEVSQSKHQGHGILWNSDHTNTFLPSTSEQQNIDHRQRYVIDQEKGVGHLKRKKMWGRVYGISFRGQIRVRSSLDDRITILKMNPSALGLCRCRQILIVSSKKCDALHLSLFLSWLV